MQKSKITYLVLQSTYQQIEVALFKDGQRLEHAIVSKLQASSQLIKTIQLILVREIVEWIDIRKELKEIAPIATELEQLDFICANLGPAPFTTLRTTITTVNGISFATKIPLVGVNGLESFAKFAIPAAENLVVIWNAFGESAYYAVRKNQKVEYGWAPISQFITNLKEQFANRSVIVCGEGLALFEQTLKTLPENFVIMPDAEKFPNIDLIARVGLEQYKNGQVEQELMPVYLKQAEPFKVN